MQIELPRISRAGRTPTRREDCDNAAMRKLTKAQRKEIAAIAAKRDAGVNLSDMPEVVDWSGAEVGKFYRPPKPHVRGQVVSKRGS